jgi:citrate/tricarballylate utilization protein
MQTLDALILDARQLASGAGTATEAVTEAARQMQICNACRYCEGFCAVFPAMTQRLEFNAADLHYMANLCHNCGACLHACQYAPPHAFAVNVPQAMAKVRGETYVAYAWPAPLGKLYQRNGLVVALALASGLALFLLLALAANGTLWGGPAGGSFYKVFPHDVLVLLFAPIFLWSVLALGVGVTRFLRDISPATSGQAAVGADAVQAASDVLTLKYLEGGHGNGCHNEDDAYSLSRRRAHHLTFYGFMLCFAATSVATIYHYAFGWDAPYELPSLPKLLGVVGGICLLLGSAGLLRLKLARHPLHGDAAQKPMDYGFIVLLLWAAASGLLLWLARGTPAMAALLALHLGGVMALFATLAYGKFAHGIYRTAALLRYAVEKRMPAKLSLGSE